MATNTPKTPTHSPSAFSLVCPDAPQKRKAENLTPADSPQTSPVSPFPLFRSTSGDENPQTPPHSPRSMECPGAPRAHRGKGETYVGALGALNKKEDGDMSMANAHTIAHTISSFW